MIIPPHYFACSSDNRSIHTLLRLDGIEIHLNVREQTVKFDDAVQYHPAVVRFPQWVGVPEVKLESKTIEDAMREADTRWLPPAWISEILAVRAQIRREQDEKLKGALDALSIARSSQ